MVDRCDDCTSPDFCDGNARCALKTFDKGAQSVELAAEAVKNATPLDSADIAQKLFAYANLLEAEKCRLHTIWQISDSTVNQIAFSRMEAEMIHVRWMARLLRTRKTPL